MHLTLFSSVAHIMQFTQISHTQYIIIIPILPLPPASHSKRLEWLLNLDSKLLQILIMLLILLDSLENNISTLFSILLSPLLVELLVRFDGFLL